MNNFPQNYFILSPFQNNNYHIQRRCFPQGIFFVNQRKAHRFLMIHTFAQGVMKYNQMHAVAISLMRPLPEG
ncbi:hypothetical protein A4V01_07810 [Erysipelotrichaceae bacterium I46]|nr:hypothetical protein A4V01_07810 [Erysipelotrichaceae bacterium I46]ASU18727.1 hypothetical protein ADH65_09495 [[Clostridium] innocuum]